MQTKIYLDPLDRIRGTGTAILISAEDIDQIALFFPNDPDLALRLCDQVVEAVEQVRHRAYSQVNAGS